MAELMSHREGQLSGKRFTHLSLFSGIGGLDLAAEMAGFETVGQCEWADYPSKILEKHWPDVPRWRDIRTLTKESFYEKTGLRTVDVLSGGFPCQPFSLAGKRTGTDDDRYLWPEMLRVIRELRPTLVIGENVPGIINMALDEVLSDLENEGYSAQTFIIPACGVDAPHKRERVCILAYACTQGRDVRRNGGHQYAESDGEGRSDYSRRKNELPTGNRRKDQSGTAGMADGLRTGIYRTDSDTDRDGLEGRSEEPLVSVERETENKIRGGGTGQHLSRTAERISGMHSAWEDWPCEPGICRVVDGVPNRLDRIKCLGNAVVPQQFYPFFMLVMGELRKEVQT